MKVMVAVITMMTMVAMMTVTNDGLSVLKAVTASFVLFTSVLRSSMCG